MALPSSSASLKKALADFEQVKNNFWNKLSGRASENLLLGEQYNIDLLWLILQQMSLLTQATTGQVPSLQPLPQPGQPTEIPSSPFQSVGLIIGEAIGTNAPFSNFKAPFAGTAVLSISLPGGGILSVVEYNPNSGQESDPEVLYGGTKLNAGVRYDIPFGITLGNIYYLQSDTAGSATFQVVSYDIPIVVFPFTSSSGGGGATGVVATNILLSSTSAYTLLTYTTGTSAEALMASINLSVITGATTMIAVLSWTDPNNGARTFYWENGGSVSVDTPGYDPYPFTAEANSTVTIVLTPGTASQVYATGSIVKQV